MLDDMKIVNGYILAGGKSSRMGKDKGLLLIDSKSIVQHVIDQLQPVVAKVTIVSNNSEYEKFGFEVIGDLVKDIGPAGGIYTALSHSDTSSNFIVSCDMPFITSDAIAFIITNSNQHQITLPVYHDKTEPLFGVYTKECVTKWQELIQQGSVKLQELITYFSVMKLNVDENKLFCESIFTNINTQYDFEKVNQM